MKLAELVDSIATELCIAEIQDYPNSLNGLQMENAKGEVTKIAAAVDATLPVIRKAVAAGADLLLVHHGMFWSGAQPVTGAMFEKLKLCMDHGLAVYSVHLPLDGHAEMGNGILLGKALGLSTEWTPFFPFKNFNIGVRASVNVPRDDLMKRLEKAVGGRVHVCGGGPERVKHIGIVTGGAGSEAAAVKALGIDTFITGEGPHWSYTLAEELGINLLYGGHYATETFGVKALAAKMSDKFGLEWEFLDHPTGM
jgi:dinuclear metal center YbgI/SA1388 family protein